MATYTVQLINKEVKSVRRSGKDAAPADTFLEPTIGETIWATIEAETDEEAQQKAEKVARELQTGESKKQIEKGHS